MPKYVLHYFSGKALAQASRLLLAYGGQEFEDHVVPFDTWPELKPKMLFGKMPVLEIDGKQYAQSIAIARYLGSKFGLAGDTLEEALEIDQMVELIKEFHLKLNEVDYEPDEAVKEAKYAKRVQEVYPTYLERFDSIINKNNGHLALGKLTWADFYLTGILDYLKKMLRMPDLEEKYPSFQKVVDNVYSVPTVKAYLESAPKYDYPY